MLESVEVQGVRNLSGVKVPLSQVRRRYLAPTAPAKPVFLRPSIYWVWGAPSERTNLGLLSRHGAEYCRVVGRLREQGRSLTMGIEKYRDGGAKARAPG